MKDLPDDLAAWIGAVAGGRLTAATRQPGGARKEAWFVDVERDGGEVAELFLRYDRSDPATSPDPWTLHREAAVYLALQCTDVLIPRVYAVHPTHQAMLVERVRGAGWFGRIADPAERITTAVHFMEQLAALHRVDPGSLDLAGFPAPTTVPDLVHHELDEWEGLLRGPIDPLLAFSLRWLWRNVPETSSPVVLVQGDTGPGNFMYEGGKVTAVVDWELAHLGDPMDDIAWLTLRCTQDPFPDLPARLAEYEALTGNAIDDRRVRYYQVMAETKLMVMRQCGADRGAGAGGGGGGDIGNGLIYAMLHRRLWFEAIGAFLGVDLDPPSLPPAEAREFDWLYDAMLGQLRDVVVPRIADPLAQQRTKGFARIIKHLRELERHGPWADAEERDDLAALLGSPATSLADARAAAARAVDAGEVSETDYIRYAWRRAARDNELLRPASGALADRHWPELR